MVSEVYLQQTSYQRAEQTELTGNTSIDGGQEICRSAAGAAATCRTAEAQIDTVSKGFGSEECLPTLMPASHAPSFV